MSYQYVYFIQEGDDGPIKIGIAVNPEKRLAALQAGNPEPLVLRALQKTESPREHEAEMHERFAEWRMRGEWFHASESLVRFVSALAAEAPGVVLRRDDEDRRRRDQVRVEVEVLAAFDRYLARAPEAR